MDEIEKLQNLKKAYSIKIRCMEKELEKMERDDKEYIIKLKILNHLIDEYEAINTKIILNNMKNCNHIWVVSNITKEWDGHRVDKYEFHTCIKCGLDTFVKTRDRYDSTLLTCGMISILDEYEYKLKGTITDVIASGVLAQGIYNGIINDYPNISDEQAIIYLKHALNDIRNNKVTDEVRKKRVKRLGINRPFNQWNINDVINGE